MAQPRNPPPPARRMRGFEPAAGLLRDPLRQVAETRGFALTRLLTDWADVVGADLAAVTRPVKISYGREGFGATLVLLIPGAVAPMIEMQKARIRDRVNACYGYNAISRLHLTQTSASGFAEGQAAFAAAPKPAPEPDPVLAARAADCVAGITDDNLRAALTALAHNILARRVTQKG